MLAEPHRWGCHLTAYFLDEALYGWKEGFHLFNRVPCRFRVCGLLSLGSIPDWRLSPSQLTNEVWVCLTGADLRRKVGQAFHVHEMDNSLPLSKRQQSGGGKSPLIPQVQYTLMSLSYAGRKTSFQSGACIALVVAFFCLVCKVHLATNFTG